MDVCVVTYRNTAERIRAALRPVDTLLVHDNTYRNLGFAAGANRAAAQGSHELVVFVNPDGTPATGCLDTLEREMRQPAVVAVAASQGPDWDLEVDAEGRADWLPAACVVVRRSAFERVGGFDERLFMYGEDVDLSYKLAKLGELRLSREARFHHDPGERPFRALHRNFRNWLVVQRRHRRARPGRMLRDAVAALRAGQWRYMASRLTALCDYAVRARHWA